MSERTKSKILAVDFDDTIVVSGYSEDTNEPEIIGYNEKVVSFVKRFKANGGRVILNTCRHDHSLEVAVEYCRSLGLEFDKVNENLDEEVEMFGDCRKIFADYYLDDKAMKISDIEEFKI